MHIDKYLRENHPGFRVQGIVHAGAHFAQEAARYERMAPGTVTWIEADPAIFQILSHVVDRRRHELTAKHSVLNAALWDRDDVMLEFHRFSNDGASSSLFRSLPRKQEVWPELMETGEIFNVRSCTLDTALQRGRHGGIKANVLVLDLQGAELRCLKGAKRTLGAAQFIECEVSKEPIYDGGALFEEVDGFLAQSGFTRRTEAPWHGDVVYERVGG
jgi:FkbM family methyltransferase